MSSGEEYDKGSTTQGIANRVRLSALGFSPCLLQSLLPSEIRPDRSGQFREPKAGSRSEQRPLARSVPDPIQILDLGSATGKNSARELRSAIRAIRESEVIYP